MRHDDNNRMFDAKDEMIVIMNEVGTDQVMNYHKLQSNTLTHRLHAEPNMSIKSPKNELY